VSSVGGHRTGLGLGTSAASLGADTVGRPGSDNAVNRARESVAIGRRREAGAYDTTMGDVSDDGTRLGFGAKTARLGASTESRPFRNHAVHRASKCVTAGCRGPNGALDAAVVRVGDNRTGFGLRSNTTRFGAGSVGRPSGDLAINRAAESVAVG